MAVGSSSTKRFNLEPLFTTFQFLLSLSFPHPFLLLPLSFLFAWYSNLHVASLFSLSLSLSLRLYSMFLSLSLILSSRDFIYAIQSFLGQVCRSDQPRSTRDRPEPVVILHFRCISRKQLCKGEGIFKRFIPFSSLLYMYMLYSIYTHII